MLPGKNCCKYQRAVLPACYRIITAVLKQILLNTLFMYKKRAVQTVQPGQD